ERALQAATYHFNAGDLQRAHQLLDDLLGQAAPAHDRARAVLLLGETCHRQGRSDDAVLFLRHAVELSGGDARQAIRAELALALVTFASGGDYTAPAAAARRALELAQGLGDNALLANALAASVHAEVLLGNGVDEEKLQRALELEEQGQLGPVERRPSLLAGVVYCAAEQYPRAQEILEQLRAQ